MTPNADTGAIIERRAEFVYEGARLAARAAGAPIIPAPWAEREEPFRSQFRKVIDRLCQPRPDLRWVAERALRYIGENKPSEDLEHDLQAALGESPEKLHEDWVIAYVTMGWTFGETYDPAAKTHPDMVPYAQLGQLEQDKDSVFVALCEIARQWVSPNDSSGAG